MAETVRFADLPQGAKFTDARWPNGTPITKGDKCSGGYWFNAYIPPPDSCSLFQLWIYQADRLVIPVEEQ